MKHNYTLSGELPELTQAKINAMNISEVKQKTHLGPTFDPVKRSSHHVWCLPNQSRYKESWTKSRGGGYKLRLDAIPFQSARASAEILSDVRLYFICFWLSNKWKKLLCDT